jgi:hypothetical protein
MNARAALAVALRRAPSHAAAAILFVATPLHVMAAALQTGCESSAPSSSAPAHAAATAIDWAGEVEGVAASAPPPATVPQNTWILHIGDSFVHAFFQQHLGPRLRATGAAYVVYATTATYTTTWAADPELDEWLAKRPSLVLVTLGANEVDMPSPEEHAGAIEHLARKIAGAHAGCVWITPPLWKRDSGILQVIHDHSAPCLYFDSDAVLGGLTPDERKKDGIHPNEKGGARWADAFWQWLGEHRDPLQPRWGLVPFEHRS